MRNSHRLAVDQRESLGVNPGTFRSRNRARQIGLALGTMLGIAGSVAVILLLVVVLVWSVRHLV